MTAVIRVRFSESGMHCWPTAPERRAYLRNLHRHLFIVTVETPVVHDEREIEFHDLLEDAKDMFHISGDWSCEQAARMLAQKLVNGYSRPMTVTVSEDGECEAQVTVVPDRPKCRVSYEQSSHQGSGRSRQFP